MPTRVGRAVSTTVAGVAGWRLFKPAVFLACLVPGAILAVRLSQVLSGSHPRALGADPTKALEHATGRYALAILFITLSITPLRRLTGANALQRVRRMLGVWSFTYAALHLCTYVTFDQLCYSWTTCQFHDIWNDVTTRKFIFVGMATFTILLALAVTSTSGWVRRLKKRWQRLHRLVYVAAVLGVIHFAWGQKSDITEPLEWAAFLAVLLGFRVVVAFRKRRARLVPAVSH